MYFNLKKNILSTVLGFSLLANVGCGLKIGEPEPPVTVAKIESVQCLNPALDSLKLFFVGQATDNEVNTSVNCLGHVLQSFKDNIRGEKKDIFTPHEIATFLQNNVLENGVHFEDSFLDQLMKFKVVLVGGDPAYLQKNEIDALVKFTERMRQPLVDLNPHMKILTMNWSTSEQPQDLTEKEKIFLAAKVQFSKFIASFCQELSVNNRPYEIEDFVGFVYEIARFVNVDVQTLSTIQNSKPFLVKFKNYLIGGTTKIQGDEWLNVGLTLNESYFQVLRLKYFLENLQPGQVQERWYFYQKITHDLTALVEQLLISQQKKSLSAAELTDLLSSVSNFLPDYQIDESLVVDLGRIKVLIVGDSSESLWTIDDFRKLAQKYDVLFHSISILIDHSKYLKVSSSSESVEDVFLPTYTEFLSAEDTLNTEIARLLQNLEGQYSLQYFKDLLLHLSGGLLKGKLKLPDNFDSLFTVAQSSQSLFVGHTRPVLSSYDLQLIGTTLSRLFLHYQEYNFFLSKEKLSTNNFLTGVEKLWNKLKLTLQNELNAKETHCFSTSDFKTIILSAQQEKLLKTHLRDSSVDSLFNALWSNLLNDPNRRLAGEVRPGFDSVSLDILSTEVSYWLQTQKFITGIFEKNQTWSLDEVNSELQKILEHSSDEMNNEGLKEFKSLLSIQYGMNFDQQGFLKILTDDNKQYHFDDLSRSNLSRALARLAIRSYAQDAQRINQLQGVVQAEADLAFAQLKPLAVDLGFLEESNNTFISSRFREANLFLTVSDGDELVNFLEFHHLVLHIFSGVSRASVMQDEILKSCSVVYDRFGSPYSTDQSCLLGLYYKSTQAFLDLPGYLSLQRNLSQTEFQDYSLGLLKAIGHIENEQKQVLFSDLSLYPHIIQYVEMIYARHDLNHDGLLQKDEALLAFPVFKNLLRDLVKSYKQIKEDDLQGVFIYILKYGRPPKKESIAEVLKFVAFIRDKDQKGWDIQTRREDIGKILNYIADATKPGAVSTTAP